MYIKSIKISVILVVFILFLLSCIISIKSVEARDNITDTGFISGNPYLSLKVNTNMVYTCERANINDKSDDICSDYTNSTISYDYFAIREGLEKSDVSNIENNLKYADILAKRIDNHTVAWNRSYGFGRTEKEAKGKIPLNASNVEKKYVYVTTKVGLKGGDPEIMYVNGLPKRLSPIIGPDGEYSGDNNTKYYIGSDKSSILEPTANPLWNLRKTYNISANGKQGFYYKINNSSSGFNPTYFTFKVNIEGWKLDKTLSVVNFPIDCKSFKVLNQKLNADCKIKIKLLPGIYDVTPIITDQKNINYAYNVSLISTSSVSDNDLEANIKSTSILDFFFRR